MGNPESRTTESLAIELAEHSFFTEMEGVSVPDDANDERIHLLSSLPEELPEYTVDLLKALTETEDTEQLCLAGIIIPEVIRTGVASGQLSDSQLDELRRLWKKLLESDDPVVMVEARERFEREEPYLKERDITTYQWLGEAASAKIIQPRTEWWGAGTEILHRSRQLAAMRAH